MTSVRQWLDSLNLGQYADAFEENDFDWELLPELDHDLLKDIGVSEDDVDELVKDFQDNEYALIRAAYAEGEKQ